MSDARSDGDQFNEQENKSSLNTPLSKGLPCNDKSLMQGQEAALAKSFVIRVNLSSRAFHTKNHRNWAKMRVSHSFITCI